MAVTGLQPWWQCRLAGAPDLPLSLVPHRRGCRRALGYSHSRGWNRHREGEAKAGRPLPRELCLLWEELSVLQHVFGPHVPLGSWPELAHFYTEFSGRAVCDRELLARQRPVTGRPDEPAAIARLQHALSATK